MSTQPQDSQVPASELLVPHDFEIHRAGSQGPSPSGQQQPAPIVVIQQRSAIPWSFFLLLPALLGVLAAIMVVGGPWDRSYNGPEAAVATNPVAAPELPAPPPIEIQVKTLPSADESPNSAAAALETGAERGTTAVAAIENPPASGPESPATQRGAAEPGLAIPVIGMPSDPEEPRQDAEQETPAIGFNPPGAGGPVTPPGAVGPMDVRATQVALAGIAAEVRKQQADQAALRAVQEDLEELERKRQRDAELARQRQAQVNLQADNNRRMAFRSELKRLLTQHGDAAGPHIMSMPGENRVSAAKVSQVPEGNEGKPRSRSAAIDLSRRVEELRAHGVSEPAILGELVWREQRFWYTQGSRASPSRLVVRAARQLLLIPLTSAAPVVQARGDGQPPAPAAN